MGKITVKHYLNTNLKPYIINGDKYYSMYVLITVNRQNTKIKSNKFNEYYTENDFNEIINNKEDEKLLFDEVITIQNIVSQMIKFTDSFDTLLLSAIYNFYKNIFIFDIDIQIYKNNNLDVDLYNKNKNKLGVEIDNLFISDFSMKENNSKGMSLLTWFSNTGQIELRKFLIDYKCKSDINETIVILNDIVFKKSLEVLQWIFKGSKKYSTLLEKYEFLFQNIDCYENYLQLAKKDNKL